MDVLNGSSLGDVPSSSAKQPAQSRAAAEQEGSSARAPGRRRHEVHPAAAVLMASPRVQERNMLKAVLRPDYKLDCSCQESMGINKVRCMCDRTGGTYECNGCGAQEEEPDVDDPLQPGRFPSMVGRLSVTGSLDHCLTVLLTVRR